MDVLFFRIYLQWVGKEMRSNDLSKRQSKSGAKPAKYREKTLLEHAADALPIILKTLGKEDKKLYYCKNNELTINGSPSKFTVDGQAEVGYFDEERDKTNVEKIQVKYSCDCYIGRDSWGQLITIVTHYTVDGI